MADIIWSGVAGALAVIALWGPRSRPHPRNGRTTPPELSTPGRASSDAAHPPRRVELVVYAELLIAMLATGAPTSTTMNTLNAELAVFGLQPPRRVELITGAMHLAEETGVAPTTLIRSAARQERLRRQSATAAAAARLGVHVLLPLGVCLLPAFMVLTVVPLVIGMLS